MAQGVARAHQHRGGGHGACQHTGGEPDIQPNTLPSIMAISIALPDHHQRQHQVVFPVAEKNRKKVGPGFYANAKNKQHKAEIKGIGVNREMLRPNNRETTKTPMELPSCTEPRRSFPKHSPNASTTNNNRM
ncbi:Uncharacterised protein [Klebsiella pneumoniae]|uniref:Uncharacterized protein n=1 Tax=Klebsiella pneumoniae TaxID=573 RepID=A0A378F908_KLEPN|nr:Uncharacterised protein [Klebsiella pneumoniae]